MAYHPLTGLHYS